MTQLLFPPELGKLSFEWTMTDEKTFVSCGTIAQPIILEGWPYYQLSCFSSSECSPRMANLIWPSVQLLVHPLMDLSDVLNALIELEKVIKDRLKDIQINSVMLGGLDSVDADWMNIIAHRADYAKTGRPNPPIIRIYGVDE